MKNRILIGMVLAGIALLAACGNAFSHASSAENTAVSSVQSDGQQKTAEDGAEMQTNDKGMATRVLSEGTRIRMHFGDTVITGILNDSDTAKALIDQLPVTVHMNRYAHDFCGSASDLNLPYQEDEVHYGWLNGDIDYAIDAPWFTILFEDEDSSEQYGYQVNIGVVTSPLSDISSLNGSYDVVIELDSSAS